MDKPIERKAGYPAKWGEKSGVAKKIRYENGVLYADFRQENKSQKVEFKRLYFPNPDIRQRVYKITAQLYEYDTQAKAIPKKEFVAAMSD